MTFAGTGDSDLAWVAINTHAHKEKLALANLERQGFTVYCPMIAARVRHARRTLDVLRPLFPGYLFAAVSPAIQRWRPMLSTFGVRSVIRTGDDLVYLPRNFIEALKAREVDGAIVRPTQPFRVGQQVKMAGGPFDGLLATIVELDEKERLVVLMDLLNRPVKVKVEATSVSELPT